MKALQTKTISIVLALSASLSGAATWGYVSYARTHESTDDAYVDGHIINVSPRISGTIAQVLVNDNQYVKKGDLLARLDASDYRVKVEEARAALDYAEKQALAASAGVQALSLTAGAQNFNALSERDNAAASIAIASAKLEQLRSALEAKKSALLALQAQGEEATQDFKRYNELYSQGAVSQQQLDQASTKMAVLNAQSIGAQSEINQVMGSIKEAQAELTRARSGKFKSLGSQASARAAGEQTIVQEKQIDVSKASVEKAQADLKEAELELSYTEIRAPQDGQVGHKAMEVGQSVQAGQSLLAIIDKNVWLTANFKETQVGRMRNGEPVEITVDSYPGQKFHGTVDSVAPASGNKFAMLPADNATGNFTKVVQRIPVKIALTGSLKGELAPGMSCEVSVQVN